jgi:hypothetical protein
MRRGAAGSFEFDIIAHALPAKQERCGDWGNKSGLIKMDMSECYRQDHLAVRNALPMAKRSD